MISLSSLLELDDATILRGTDNKGIRYLGVMLSHYTQVFGESCSGCAKKHPYYLQRLRNLDMEKEQIKSVFKLKKDKVIPIMGTSEAYSAKNLTDEAALKILSRNPNAIVLFTEKPENWEELVEAYKSGETKINSIEELSKLKVDAIRTLFPDAKGRSKEDLLFDISQKYPELTKSTEETTEDTESSNEDESPNDQNSETDVKPEETKEDTPPSE